MHNISVIAQRVPVILSGIISTTLHVGRREHDQNQTQYHADQVYLEQPDQSFEVGRDMGAKVSLDPTNWFSPDLAAAAAVARSAERPSDAFSARCELRLHS